MSNKIAYIHSRKNLKDVLNFDIQEIAVLDKKLAQKIIKLKSISKFNFVVVLVVLLFCSANFINPFGLISVILAIRFFGYSLISSITYLVCVLGLKKLFKVFFKCKISYFTEPEDEINGETIYLKLII